MKIRPLNDKVIVKRTDPEKMTKGGLYIPDDAQEQTISGEVLAVGPGKLLENGERKPLGIEPGNVVLFSSKYAGTEVELEGEKYLIVNGDDIVGVEEPE